ncbi:hypothetical protein [Streptomyces sp. NPDC002573]|uniref:hypothetical protein n=1 Tax=Streptomyces sp. NPDC002573 TaxID=3364651 RepID=UPI00367F9BCB
MGHVIGKMSVEIPIERRVAAREAYQLHEWLNWHQFLLEGMLGEPSAKGRADGSAMDGVRHETAQRRASLTMCWIGTPGKAGAPTSEGYLIIRNALAPTGRVCIELRPGVDER